MASGEKEIVMGTIVMALRDPQSAESSIRCEALAAFACRLRQLGGEDAQLVEAPTDSALAIRQLADVAWVIGDGSTVTYIPSREARQRVAAGEDGEWPSMIASRHGKMVRRSPGVIFRFPLEPDQGGPPGSRAAVADHPAESEATEAFVTDWTGFPSSCALVVHPAHPLSTGLGPGERASFTGRFCRHPLSGDLLPIWVADFVKAEFGTAAVLLNPGHNAPDLEFCRHAGLPVRFSLLATGHDSSPASWLNPPFIKQGVARRSGFADGKPFSEAKDVYLAAMTSWGLAKEHTDIGMGLFEIAAVADDGEKGTRLPWDARRRTLAPASEPGARQLNFAVSPVLSAVEQAVREAGRLTVVVSSTGVESELLGLRLVLAEQALGPVAAHAPDVILCGPALPSKQQVEPDVLRLALLVTAAPLQAVALKAPNIEAAERFLKVHESLAGTEGIPTGEAPAQTMKAAAQVKRLLEDMDLKQAFTQLYRLQKNIAKLEQPSQGELRAYAALAYALVGSVGSGDPGQLAAVWREIS